MAFVIRRPTDRDMGKPDVTIIVIVAPVTVAVEIVVADDVIGEILSRA
jgi:hypothetical protein